MFPPFPLPLTYPQLNLLILSKNGPPPPLPLFSPHSGLGMVIAVKGTVKESGELWVDDWCPAGLPPPAVLGGTPSVPSQEKVENLEVSLVHDCVSLRLCDFIRLLMDSAFLNVPRVQSVISRLGRVGISSAVNLGKQRLGFWITNEIGPIVRLNLLVQGFVHSAHLCGVSLCCDGDGDIGI